MNCACGHSVFDHAPEPKAWDPERHVFTTAEFTLSGACEKCDHGPGRIGAGVCHRFHPALPLRGFVESLPKGEYLWGISRSKYPDLARYAKWRTSEHSSKRVKDEVEKLNKGVSIEISLMAEFWRSVANMSPTSIHGLSRPQRPPKIKLIADHAGLEAMAVALDEERPPTYPDLAWYRQFDRPPGAGRPEVM